MTHDKILTDVPGKTGGFWAEHTELIGPSRPPAWLLRATGKKFAYRLLGIWVGCCLILQRNRYPAVVTGGGASGMLFAWLQTLLPWGSRPHVMVDCNWYLPQSHWGRWWKAFQLRLAARSVRSFVVWASHEVEDYTEAFGLPRELLEYVPFHDSLINYDYQTRDEGYLFAGGNYDRDYATLVEAVHPLEVPVWIATTRPEVLPPGPLPAHVRVAGTTEAGFRQALAGARLVVIPMQGGLLHSGGQQTLLNALLLGKPTIAVGIRWASDFLVEGDTGLMVDYGNVAGLRDAIAWVLSHPEESRQMALRGQRYAAQFTTNQCMEAIYSRALQQASAVSLRPSAPPMGVHG